MSTNQDLITRGLGVSSTVPTRGFGGLIVAAQTIMNTAVRTAGGVWAGAGDVLGRLR